MHLKKKKDRKNGVLMFTPKSDSVLIFTSIFIGNITVFLRRSKIN